MIERQARDLKVRIPVQVIIFLFNSKTVIHEGIQIIILYLLTNLIVYNIDFAILYSPDLVHKLF
jgi:hypothetical protein